LLDGFVVYVPEKPGLPGGYPMNGGFAATFLQRPPPAGAGIARKGRGIPQASHDVEAAKPENGRSPAVEMATQA